MSNIMMDYKLTAALFALLALVLAGAANCMPEPPEPPRHCQPPRFDSKKCCREEKGEGKGELMGQEAERDLAQCGAQLTDKTSNFLASLGGHAEGYDKRAPKVFDFPEVCCKTDTFAPICKRSSNHKDLTKMAARELTTYTAKLRMQQSTGLWPGNRNHCTGEDEKMWYEKNCCKGKPSGGGGGGKDTTSTRMGDEVRLSAKILANLWACIRELVMNIGKKDRKYPLICCKAPLFHLGCKKDKPEGSTTPRPNKTTTTTTTKGAASTTSKASTKKPARSTTEKPDD